MLFATGRFTQPLRLPESKTTSRKTTIPANKPTGQAGQVGQLFYKNLRKGETMLKEVQAYIRQERINKVIEALEEVGIYQDGGDRVGGD